MIDYADLLAGRALIALGMLERGQVIGLLSQHDRARGQRARFIANLVETSQITSRQGQKVFALVQRTRRSLAQAIHLECLKKMKSVDLRALDQAVEVYESDPGGHSLDRILLNQGLVSEPEHRRLRSEAHDCIERQQAKLLSRFRRSLKHHCSATEVIQLGNPELHAQTEVFREERRIETEPEIPLLWEPETLSANGRGTSVVQPAVAAKILTANTAFQTQNTPRFEMPPWLSSAGAMQDRVIAGYHVFGKIGEGGMGIVFYAEHDDLDEPIALKLLPPDKRRDEDALGRFHREILAMSFFDHENVVTIKDAGDTQDGSMFLAMEFFDGRELMDILEEVDIVPASIALPIFIDVLKGLGAAHKAGILHRDLKPENILVSYKDNTAKLMDFGIARILDRSSFEQKIYRSMAGTVTGTPEYLSPEQATDLPLDQRSDLYSFGVMMYLVLSGEFPIEAESAQEFISAHMMQEPIPLHERYSPISRELSDIVMRLLEKEPEDRMQSAEHLIVALEKVLADLG
ncbi:MAG: serine/threonine-protein kinase [Planctomycetota bacterium]|nr:serine/threonine-protein kinase [Planctomycetota bacterium]